MARREQKPAILSRSHSSSERSSPENVTIVRIQQLQAKWHDLGADALRAELRRIVGELRLYDFRNRAGPLEHALPFLELAALADRHGD